MFLLTEQRSRMSTIEMNQDNKLIIKKESVLKLRESLMAKTKLVIKSSRRILLLSSKSKLAQNYQSHKLSISQTCHNLIVTSLQKHNQFTLTIRITITRHHSNNTNKATKIKCLTNRWIHPVCTSKHMLISHIWIKLPTKATIQVSSNKCYTANRISQLINKNTLEFLSNIKSM